MACSEEAIEIAHGRRPPPGEDIDAESNEAKAAPAVNMPRAREEIVIGATQAERAAGDGSFAEIAKEYGTDMSGLSPDDTGRALGAARTLDDVRAVLGECVRCKLAPTRKNIVFGVGNPNADLMFVGEGPGADEDEQGEPFVGRAGQLLTKMIEAMGVTRKDVYIANVVKCRPPKNREPEPDEIAACSPFLRAQIRAIRPKVICTLGNPATRLLLDTMQGISKMRGRFHDLDGIPVMPTFHPSYLLRSPQYKGQAWEDLQIIMDHLGWKRPEKKAQP
ncbi:uracil-DNA glycosylase [bacterium]|nr:uracil-DNA glycosylase [bacterium]